MCERCSALQEQIDRLEATLESVLEGLVEANVLTDVNIAAGNALYPDSFLEPELRVVR